jgi:hypothetical protein
VPNRTEIDFRHHSGDLIGGLYEAAVEGVRDYYRDHPSVNHKHRSTTRRSVIRDYIVHRLRAMFDEATGAVVIDKRGTTYFGINSKFLGLVRKLNEEFAVALNKTQAALDFQANTSAAALPGDGFDGATNAYTGYVPEKNDPMNPRVYVVCPNDEGYDWALELKRDAGGAVAPIPFIPDPGTDPENLVKLPDVEKREPSDGNE